MQTTDQLENQEHNLQTKTVEHQNNITFVQEVEKYPCLYNYMVCDYNRKDAMDAAWVEIGRKFGISGLECKEKWKNIRSVFVRHLKPLHNSRSARLPRKPYYLSRYLQFAVPFLKTTRPPNSKDEEEDTSRDSPYMAKNYRQYYGNEEDNNLQSLDLQSPKSEPVEAGGDNQNFPEVHAWASESLKRPNESIEDDAFNFLQIKDERVENHSNKMFLLSLMPDLCSMNDKQKRYFKRKVLELIENILEEEK